MPTLPQEVKYGEDLDIDKAPVLSAEELHTLKQRMLAMDKLLAEKKQAKYKIELFFASQYRAGQPFPGAVSFWLSGSKMHGGGDEKIYLCPGPECGGLIPPSSQGYGHLVCSKCGQVWKGTQVQGEVLARLTLQGWSDLIYKWFRTLEFNCDIYQKRPRRDVRAASALEQARQLGGEKLNGARRSREVSIYPLRNIVKETSAGSDILGRFRAFLSS